MRIRIALTICALALAFAVSAAMAGGAAAHQLGTQKNLKTLVLMVKFQNDPADPLIPVTADTVRASIFDGPNSVNSFFLESSWGTVGLSGLTTPEASDIFGYYTVPVDKPDQCTTSNIGAISTQPVDDAARAAGVDVDAYDRIVYAYGTCGWGGRSYSIEGTKRVWVLGDALQTPGVIAHELQHQERADGITIGHADLANCYDGSGGLLTPSSIADSCMRVGYGDGGDVMGNAEGENPSSFYTRMGMGFLPRTLNQVATTPGTYTIQASTQAPAPGTYNLQIPIASEPNITQPTVDSPNRGGGRPSYLNLEYRQPGGQFDHSQNFANLYNGAAIRMAPGWGDGYYPDGFTVLRSETYLIDTDMHTRGFDFFAPAGVADYYQVPTGTDLEDPLSMDTGFYDPVNEVLLRVAAQDSSQIQIEYSRGRSAAEKTQIGVFNRVLTVNARAGYANDIFARVVDDALIVRDGDAPTLAGEGCTAVARNVASCPLAGFDSVRVNAGDRRDYVDVNAGDKPVALSGGAGNDVLIGGDAGDVIDGSSGNDTIIANGGDDVVLPGAGADDVNLGTGDDGVAGDDDGSVDKYVCGDGEDSLSAGGEDQVDASCEPFTEGRAYITTGPTEGSTTALRAPVFNFVSTDGSGLFECSLDGGADWNECNSTYTMPTQPNGPAELRVRVLGSGAPPAVRTFNIDGKPLISISSPPAGDIQPSEVVHLAASVIQSQTTECSYDDSPFAACSFVNNFHDFGSEGDHTLKVRATDSMGVSTTATRSFTVDGLRVDISAPSAGQTIGGTQIAPEFSTSFSATAQDAGAADPVTYTCSIDGAAPVACSSGGQLTGIANGSHSLRVRATDAIGYAGSATVNFSTDSVAPETTITSGPSGTVTSSTQTFEFNSSEPDSTFRCQLDGDAETTCSSPSTYAALTTGAHSFSVAAVDAAGNRDATPATASFTIAVPATLSVSGPATFSSPVNLTSAGGLDWVHWGRSSASTVDRRSGANMVSDAALLPGGGSRTRTTSSMPTYSWSDGSPVASAQTASGIYVGGGANRGFSLSAPAANGQLRVLKLYLGALATTGKLTVSLSDGSAPQVINTGISTSSLFTPVNRVITVSYRSSAPSATLDVDWRQNTSSVFGRVYLESAALSAG